jgi:hypothetical protein
MTILREKQAWSRRAPGAPPKRSWQLTAAEQVNVKAAIRKLRARYGRKRVAELMGVGLRTLRHSTEAKHRVSPGMALCVARIAWAPVEQILAGRWPGPQPCPFCGSR